MNEIKELLDAWERNGLTNPDGLENALEVLKSIAIKLEQLEEKINDKVQ